MPYQLYMNSTKHSAAYLLRQYFTYNLADRMSTYPTPTDIEKRWIVYQLLCALEQAHAKGICHGAWCGWLGKVVVVVVVERGRGEERVFPSPTSPTGGCVCAGSALTHLVCVYYVCCVCVCV